MIFTLRENGTVFIDSESRKGRLFFEAQDGAYLFSSTTLKNLENGPVLTPWGFVFMRGEGGGTFEIVPDPKTPAHFYRSKRAGLNFDFKVSKTATGWVLAFQNAEIQVKLL